MALVQIPKAISVPLGHPDRIAAALRWNLDPAGRAEFVRLLGA